MIFSRVYAWLAAIGAAIVLFFSIYLKGRSDSKASRAAEDNRRLRDAIEADSRGRERIARGELLHDDGFRRD